MDVARAITSVPTVSITKNPAFLGLRTCAGSCIFANNFGLESDLKSFIGCTYPVYDPCYCNSAIVAQASSFISGCVSSACNEVADVPNAFSAYAGYCSTAGYPVAVAAQTTVETIETVTSGTVTAPTTLLVTVPSTLAPTVTATIPGGTPGSLDGNSATPSLTNVGAQSTATLASTATPAQLNVGAIAGGAVGGAVVLGIVAIIITMLCLRERRRSRREQASATPPAWLPTPAMQRPSAPVALAVAEKIPKTPTVVHTTPVYSPQDAWRQESELDGIVRMNPELDVLGGHVHILRGNLPEMQT